MIFNNFVLRGFYELRLIDQGPITGAFMVFSFQLIKLNRNILLKNTQLLTKFLLRGNITDKLLLMRRLHQIGSLNKKCMISFTFFQNKYW